jgi:NAD(P)-dependent dehydrogenase (short-subunit alcohol dehydrogenase family)
VVTFKELSSLRGRVAIVTGACGYLGQEICDTLAELGADLFLVDNDSEKMRDLSLDLKSKWNSSVKTFFCDLSKEESRNRLIMEVYSEQKKINILVNNAAITGNSLKDGWAVPFSEQSLTSWNAALEINLTACFHLSQQFTPLLLESAGANILNIGSIYGVYGPDWSLYEGTSLGNPAAYSITKAGLIQLTRWLSKTVSPSIRVNSISPGGILRNQEELFIKKYSSRTPLNRMAVENDFRGPVGMITSDLGKYITGQNLVVDGGWGI